MAKVSILVAAYNVEKYIAQTLQSCIDQTLNDIEILVVDDASTDTTKDIIEFFAAQDKRIRSMAHEQNKGLMLARKTAYTTACGDYILFLDGDDFLAPDACESAYNVAIKENADIVQFSAKIHVEQNASQSDDAIKEFEKVFEVVDSSILATKDGGLFTDERILSVSHSAVCKLFTKDLVQKVADHIPEKHIYFAEDMLFSFIAFYYAKSIIPLSAKLYNYRFGTGISTTSDISFKKASLIAPTYQVYLEMKNFADTCPSIPVHMQTKLNRSKTELILKLCHMLLTQVAEKDRNDILNIILQYCPKIELTSGLLYTINNIGIVEPEELAEFCCKLNFTQAKDTQIVKVGITNSSNSDSNHNFAPDKIPTAQSSFDEISDYAHQLKFFIESKKIDALIDCRNNPDLFLTNLLLCKIHNIPFFIKFNNPLQSTFDTTLYGIRKLLTLHRILRCCDGVIPYSDTDTELLNNFGVPCVTQENLIASSAVQHPKSAFSLFTDALTQKLTLYLKEENSESADNLAASVAYSQTLEQQLTESTSYSKDLELQLKECVSYAKDLEQQLRASVEYAHNLEKQLKDIKTQPLPQKGKFANLFKR